MDTTRTIPPSFTRTRDSAAFRRAVMVPAKNCILVTAEMTKKKRKGLIFVTAESISTYPEYTLRTICDYPATAAEEAVLVDYQTFVFSFLIFNYQSNLCYIFRHTFLTIL